MCSVFVYGMWSTVMCICVYSIVLEIRKWPGKKNRGVFNLICLLC